MSRSAGISQSAYNALMDAYAQKGTIAAAARAIGIHHNSAREYIRGNYKPAPDTDMGLQTTIDSLRRELEVARNSLKDATRPRYSIRQDIASKGERLKVIVIGDAHDSPHLENKERFVHIGKHINAVRPDVVVQIGDFGTFDSVSTHTGNHTLEGKTKPTYTEDINSFRLALDAIGAEIKYKPELHVTLGNHERRLYAFQNEHPEVDGMMSEKLHRAFDDRGWTYSPYGEPTFYGGVAFLHAAINRMGKTFGGKTSENQIANESLTDVVVGHSHIKRVVKFAKLHHRHITVVNAGCALPHGYVENYAQHAMTGWSYGVMTLTIKDNHITDDEWVSMETLGERYGKKR